jgi:hypothetical protein
MIDPELKNNILTIIKEKEIFLITSLFGSSNGSAFLNTLFDGHPDIYTFPHPIQTYINLEHFWDIDQSSHLDHILADEIFFNTSLGNNKNRGDGFHMLGEYKDEGFTVDRELFKSYLNNIILLLEWNEQNYILAVVVAFNWARGVIPNSSRFVLYVHDTSTTKYFERIFDQFKTVAICRHPLNVFVSLCKQSKQKALDRDRLLGSISYAFIGHFYDFLILRSNVGVVLLEELHANPDDSMRKIADYMGINFHESLLQSTAGGLKWWGIRVSILNGFLETLHKEVKTGYSGRNIESAIYNATRNFQEFIGYSGISKKRNIELRMYLPGMLHVRYYKESFSIFLQLFRKQESNGAIVKLILNYMRVLFYSFAFKYMDQVWLYRCRMIDKRHEFKQKLQVINPLQNGAINIPDFRLGDDDAPEIAISASDRSK